MDKQPNKLLKPKTPSSTSAKWNKSSTKAATTSNDNSSSDNFDINSILSRHRKEMEEQEPSQSVEFTTADVNILPPTQVISQLLKMQVVHQATIRFEKEVDAAMERYKKTVSQSTTTTTSSIESTLKEASSLADDQQMDEVTILFNSCTQGLREAAKDGDDSVGSALSNQETLDCLVVLLALYNAASPQDLPKSKLRQPAAELVGRLFADNAGALVDAVTRQLKTLSGQMYFGSMEHFDVFECFVFLPVCQLTHDRLLCSLSLLGSLFNLNPEKVKKEVVSATALEDLLLSLVTLNSLFSESAGMGCVRAKRIRQAIKDFARRHLFISLSGKTPNAGQTEQQQQQQCIQFKVLPSGNSRHLTTLLTAFLRLIHFLKKHICPFDNKKHLWRENEAIISDLWYWLANFLQRLEEDFISKSTAELAIKKLGRPFSTASHSSASSLSSLSDWSDDDDDFDGPSTSAMKKRTPTKRPEKKYSKISTDQFPEKNDRFCAPPPPITVGEASKKRENISSSSSSSSSSQSRDTIGADCGTGSPLLQWEKVEGDNGDDDKSSQKHELCRLLYLHFEDSFGWFFVFFAPSH